MGLKKTVWLFDLDDTLHDASHAAFGPISQAMARYIETHIGLPSHEAHALRQHYWNRYGATLLGLVRHHGIHGPHFLEEIHRLPGLEERLRASAHDRAALQALPGRKFVLTNAPRVYALRVLAALHLTPVFEDVISIEDMRMFGHWRPKPDARMLRSVAARLKVLPSRCVLVEDTLVHQRAARRIGMRAVWMQRYTRQSQGRPKIDLPPRGAWREATGSGAVDLRVKKCMKVGVHACAKPPYVYARIQTLQSLRRLK